MIAHQDGAGQSKIAPAGPSDDHQDDQGGGRACEGPGPGRLLLRSLPRTTPLQQIVDRLLRLGLDDETIHRLIRRRWNPRIEWAPFTDAQLAAALDASEEPPGKWAEEMTYQEWRSLQGRDKAELDWEEKINEAIGPAMAELDDEDAPKWAAPKPLPEENEPPPFPTHLLPNALAGWVEAEAEATQTPPDLAAMLALAIGAAGLAGKVRVEVRPGWTEPANLMHVVALPVGERKSVVFGNALDPVRRVEKELREEVRPKRAAALARKKLLQEVVKQRTKDAAKGKATTEEVEEAAEELAKITVPSLPQLYCDDETPEHLPVTLAEQGERMLVASPEGTLFSIAAGRYCRSGPNFDVYLKGHAGDPLRVGRVGRASQDLEAPAVSTALAVQPAVLEALAKVPEFAGKGLLARFNYAVPRPRVGNRKVNPTPAPQAVREEYAKAMARLWKPGDGSAVTVKFTDAADEAMMAFQQWMEPQLTDGKPLSQMAGWANKLAGTVARIALLFHAMTLDGQDDEGEKQIGAEEVQQAVALAKEYLIPHAKLAFALMGREDPNVRQARRVLSWIVNCVKSVDYAKELKISKRDIHAGVWGGSRTTEQVQPVLDVLVEHEFLCPLPMDATATRKAGRKPSPEYRIHPAVFEK